MELYLSTQHNSNGSGFTANDPERRSSLRSSFNISYNDLNIADRVTLSEEAKTKDLRGNKPADDGLRRTSGIEAQGFSSQELQQLRTLKLRDAEVRSHEQAHMSVAGRYARGGASFTFQKGPDGGSYAIGGEVGIDVSTEASPEATIAKMQTVKRAALAPLQPSPADRQIAAQASVKEQSARQQLIEEQHEALLSAEPITQNKKISTSTSLFASSNNFALDRYTVQNPPNSTFITLA